jgi:hypothetical protein
VSFTIAAHEAALANPILRPYVSAVSYGSLPLDADPITAEVFEGMLGKPIQAQPGMLPLSTLRRTMLQYPALWRRVLPDAKPRPDSSEIIIVGSGESPDSDSLGRLVADMTARTIGAGKE